jgi:hypothetical protein
VVIDGARGVLTPFKRGPAVTAHPAGNAGHGDQAATEDGPLRPREASRPGPPDPGDYHAAGEYARRRRRRALIKASLVGCGR